jgi:hypothetical protein
MLYVVGLLANSLDRAEDGFVYAMDAGTLNPQYMLRVVSLDRDPSSGGRRVLSAVLGAGSYNGYAYITGTGRQLLPRVHTLQPIKHNRHSKR